MIQCRAFYLSTPNPIAIGSPKGDFASMKVICDMLREAPLGVWGQKMRQNQNYSFIIIPFNLQLFTIKSD
jgi:hypothetical protein